MSKALEVQTVETEAAKNKAKVVARVMKDGFFNPQIDEGSDAVVSKEKSIPATTSKNKEKIKQTRHGKLRASTEINNASTSSIVCSNSKGLLITKKSTSSENLLKRMKVKKTIGYGFSVGHSMDMDMPLTRNSSNSSVT